MQGSVLNNRYTITIRIGQGAMGKFIRHLDRLCAGVAHAAYETRGGTVSLGVTCLSAESDVDTLPAAADAALY